MASCKSTGSHSQAGSENGASSAAIAGIVAAGAAQDTNDSYKVDSVYGDPLPQTNIFNNGTCMLSASHGLTGHSTDTSPAHTVMSTHDLVSACPVCRMLTATDT